MHRRILLRNHMLRSRWGTDQKQALVTTLKQCSFPAHLQAVYQCAAFEMRNWSKASHGSLPSDVAACCIWTERLQKHKLDAPLLRSLPNQKAGQRKPQNLTRPALFAPCSTPRMQRHLWRGGEEHAWTGLAYTVYIRYVYGISSRKITKYTHIYGVYIYGFCQPYAWSMWVMKLALAAPSSKPCTRIIKNNNGLHNIRKKSAVHSNICD